MSSSADPPIFSPSLSRIHASQSRDWSYLETWLVNTLSLPSAASLPPFERSPDTLKALLALASHNESINEDLSLLAQAEGAALEELRHAELSNAESASGSGRKVSQGQTSHLREDLLYAIEEELPKEGQVALDALANMVVQSGMAFPDPHALGRKVVELQGEVFELEQASARVDVLHRHIQAEAAKTKEKLQQLQSEAFRPHPELAKKNLETQRMVKTFGAHPTVPQDRAYSSKSGGEFRGFGDSSHPTIEDIAREEEEYLTLLSQKKELDTKMAAFEGLPADVKLARADVDALRRQLRDVTSRRDAVFEGLVERESPVKPQRR